MLLAKVMLLCVMLFNHMHDIFPKAEQVTLMAKFYITWTKSLFRTSQTDLMDTIMWHHKHYICSYSHGWNQAEVDWHQTIPPLRYFCIPGSPCMWCLFFPQSFAQGLGHVFYICSKISCSASCVYWESTKVQLHRAAIWLQRPSTAWDETPQHTYSATHIHTHAHTQLSEMRDIGLVQQLRYSTRALGSFRGFPPRESDTLSDLH